MSACKKADKLSPMAVLDVFWDRLFLLVLILEY